MKLRKLWRMVGAAIAISVLVATLFGTATMAKGPVSEPGNSLSIEVETVHGHIGPGAVCVPLSQYSPGDQIVWRIWVRDANSNLLDNTRLQSVFVNISGVQIPGGHLEAEYESHGPLGYFWSVVWTIPTDYAITGSLSFQVVAIAKDGSVGTLNDFGSILILSP